MKRRKIKLNPYDIKLTKNRGGFNMTVMADTKTHNEYEIEFYFEDWWVKHFHSKFEHLLSEKANDAITLRNLFTRQDPPF